jgi:hypothetical protein
VGEQRIGDLGSHVFILTRPGVPPVFVHSHV